MENYTLTLGKKKRSLIAGLNWYSTDASLNKQNDKLSTLKKAETTYKDAYSKSQDVELSGILLRNSRTAMVGFTQSTNVTGKTFALQELALRYAEARWPLPTVVIRLALTSDVYWVTFIIKGQLSLASDSVCSKKESDALLEKAHKRAGASAHSIDIQSTEDARAELLSWEKSVKKKLHEIKSFEFLKKRRLSESKGFKQVVSLLSVAFILVAANTGYNTYQGYQERIQERERLERLRLLQDIGPAPRPWTEVPHLASAYQECMRRYIQTPISNNGWLAGDWSCNQRQEKREWIRGSYGSFSVLPVDSAFSVRSPNNLTEIKSIEPAPQKGNVPIVNRLDAARFIMDIARLHQYRVSFRWGNENTRRVPRGDTYITESLGHANHRVEFVGNQYPNAEMINSLSKIPSLHLDEIEFSSNRWTLTVEFYSEA